MSALVERVARAIAKSHFERLDRRVGVGTNKDAIAKVVDTYWNQFTDQARAAIVAVREPTPAMKRAGSVRVQDFNDAYDGERLAEAVLAAMIDAALR